MLKDYLAKIGKSIYALSQESGIPYSTLNDLANNKVEIDNCKVSLIRTLSEVLGITMDEVYRLSSAPEHMLTNTYGSDVTISVKNKSYYASFDYLGEEVELELCKVNEDTTYYVDEIGKWRSEDYIREQRMESFE